MKKITIIYNGQKIKVSGIVAEYLETERKREQAEARSDRRHLSDKDIGRNDIDDFISDKPADFVDRIVSDSEAEYLRQALKTLTDTQRRRVQMYFFDGFSYVRIAEFEGVSEKNIRKSISESLQKLKKFWD